MFLSNIRFNLRRCRDMLCGMWCALVSVFSAISTAHITRDAPSLQFGYGFDSDDTAVLVTIVGTLISPVGEARPRIPRLEMETFHERVFHRFGSIPRNGTGVMRDEFVLAIVTGMGVPEMEDVRFSDSIVLSVGSEISVSGVGVIGREGVSHSRSLTQGKVPEAFPPVARQQEREFCHYRRS